MLKIEKKKNTQKHLALHTECSLKIDLNPMYNAFPMQLVYVSSNFQGHKNDLT